MTRGTNYSLHLTLGSMHIYKQPAHGENLLEQRAGQHCALSLWKNESPLLSPWSWMLAKHQARSLEAPSVVAAALMKAGGV